jgi:hypothetical protein
LDGLDHRDIPVNETGEKTDACPHAGTPWVTKQNESKPRRVKENLDKALELLSSLTGLNSPRAVDPPLKWVGYFHAALRALNSSSQKKHAA